jgi:hypothetical protein
VSAGEVGQDAAGFGEADVGAVPDCQVPQRLRDVGLADADRAVEDHALAGVQPAQRGEVADLRGGQFGAGVEVELLQGGLGVEVRAAQPAAHRGQLAAADLVVAEGLQELQMPEFPAAGLGEAGVEGVEHPGQLQRAQSVAQGGVDDGHDASSLVSAVSVAGLDPSPASWSDSVVAGAW